jgi:hypothetical protein
MGSVLHLFPADKQLAVLYWLGLCRGYSQSPVLIVSVRGVHHPVQPAPDWPAREVVTPAFVRQVAEWVIAACRPGERGGAESRTETDRVGISDS